MDATKGNVFEVWTLSGPYLDAGGALPLVVVTAQSARVGPHREIGPRDDFFRVLVVRRARGAPRSRAPAPRRLLQSPHFSGLLRELRDERRHLLALGFDRRPQLRDLARQVRRVVLLFRVVHVSVEHLLLEVVVVGVVVASGVCHVRWRWWCAIAELAFESAGDNEASRG